MESKKMLIGTDFDGTINIHGEVSEEDRRAIDRWRADGRYFGVVTGRGTDFFDTEKEKNLPYDYTILYNGSLVADKDDNVIFSSVIPDDVYRGLSNLFSKFEDAEYYMEYDGKPIMQFYATFDNTERALEAADAVINSELSDKIAVFVNGRHVNIGNKGTGKGEAIDIVLGYLGLPPDSAAAVGDDYNDLNMIMMHNGWAVESGKPDVVAKAPHTCSSVAAMIDELMQNQ